MKKRTTTREFLRSILRCGRRRQQRHWGVFLFLSFGGIREGEDAVLPNSCTAFDAATAREDTDTGLRDAIAAYEATPNRGGDVTPEIALSLFTVLARRHPERTPFGAYVRALPSKIPDTPLTFSDVTLQALLRVLPLSLVDAIDTARQDLYQLWDVAAAVMDHVDGGSGSEKAEAPLELDEFFWAWMMIRSRAITFRVKRGSDGVVEARRCMVPVVDFMNHACRPPPTATASSSSSSSSSSCTFTRSVPGTHSSSSSSNVATVAAATPSSSSSSDTFSPASFFF